MPLVSVEQVSGQAYDYIVIGECFTELHLWAFLIDILQAVVYVHHVS